MTAAQVVERIAEIMEENNAGQVSAVSALILIQEIIKKEWTEA